MNDGGPHERQPAVRRLLVGDDRGQHILRVEDADHLVERFADTRESARAPSCECGRAPRDHGVVGIDADDVDARHHDLLHLGLAEREHAVNQLLFGERHIGLGGDDLAKLLGRCFAFARVRRRGRNDHVDRAIDGGTEGDRRAQDDANGMRDREQAARTSRPGVA